MNGDVLSEKLMSIVADQARASAEMAATQRENVEHIKDLHERSREQGVVMDKVAERMERMDTARATAVAEITQQVIEARQSLEKHVSTEVLVAAAKLQSGMKVVAALIGFSATLIAAAIGFAAVWWHK